MNFKCQHSGCGGGHHTLMHRNPPQQQLQPSQVPVRSGNETGAGNGNGVGVLLELEKRACVLELYQSKFEVKEVVK